MAVALEAPRARRSGALGLSTAVRMPSAIRAVAENADGGSSPMPFWTSRTVRS
ncbi:hypothetical protein ACU4GG_01540 [Streptomyces nojiriensis]